MVSKEKSQKESSEKAKERTSEFELLSEEEWRRVLQKSREATEAEEEIEDETAVLVMPVSEKPEKSLEDYAREVANRLSRQYIWIAKRGRYGFMFVVPTSEEDIERWGAEWAGFTVDWCREMLIHIISSRTLVMLEPFNGLRPDRHKAVKIILGVLVKEELGRWVDESEGIVRIIWKTDEEWADEIRKWALKTGRTQFTLFKLREFRKDLATLPKSELRIILERLVDQKLAKWLDSEREVVEILV